MSSRQGRTQRNSEEPRTGLALRGPSESAPSRIGGRGSTGTTLRSACLPSKSSLPYDPVTVAITGLDGFTASVGGLSGSGNQRATVTTHSGDKTGRRALYDWAMDIGGPPAIRLERLTSLRLFAALAVFGFHATAFFSGPTREVLDFVFGQGRSGVTFFFILSGFVLAWSARPGDRPLAFYRRRFARIYPAYMVALGIAASLWALRDPSALLRGSLTPFLLQAWVPDSTSYFAINVPAWSLSVEAFFYLLFPLAIVAFRRLSSPVLWFAGGVLVAITTAIAFYASLTTGPSDLAANTFRVWFAIYFPVSRLPEFLLGVALALLMKRGDLPRIPWALAVALVLATWAAMSAWPSIYSVSAVYMIPFGILVASAAQRDIRGVPGWLRAPLIVEGGAISYCFYLLHHILIMRLSQQGFAALGFSGWFAFAVTLVLSLVGAWTLHRFVELPVDRMLRGRREVRPERHPIEDSRL